MFERFFQIHKREKFAVIDEVDEEQSDEWTV
jgi:hypothetical protein